MLQPNTRNNFIPASRYYGDKFARTMDEAFGPGAKLTTEVDEFDKAFDYGFLALAVFVVSCWILWALVVQ